MISRIASKLISTPLTNGLRQNEVNSRVSLMEFLLHVSCCLSWSWVCFIKVRFCSVINPLPANDAHQHSLSFKYFNALMSGLFCLVCNIVFDLSEIVRCSHLSFLKGFYLCVSCEFGDYISVMMQLFMTHLCCNWL